MSLMSIQTQKKIMWIPFANFINIFTWLSSTKRMTTFQKKWTLILGFSCVIFCALLQFGIEVFFPKIATYSGGGFLYLFPVVLNWGFILIQEKSESNSAREKSANSQKPLWLIIAGCILVAVLVVAGLICGVTQQIPDQNGDKDTALAVLTREDIINGKNCAMLNHSMTGTGSRSNAQSSYADVDYTAVYHQYGKLSGVQTAHATKTSGQRVTLTVTTTLESGNMEVAILIDGEYYCCVPLNQTVQITLDDICGKTVLVRVAGESAKGTVSVTRG